jgi:hypothetical protein
MPDLKNVLVLCAPYGAINKVTYASLQKLRDAQAMVVIVDARCDVSLTRCIEASSALDMLDKHPEIHWIFWLDSDMTCSAESVAALVQYSTLLHDSSDSKLYPSLGGAYVNRHSSAEPQIAAYKLRDAEPVFIKSGEDDVMFVPALCGLGAFLQHRRVFIEHCDSSPHFYFPDRNHIVPEVCVARTTSPAELGIYIDVPADNSKLRYWTAEDFDYCMRELDLGHLVYLAPVPFGHQTHLVLVPDANCIMPGLKEPPAASK